MSLRFQDRTLPARALRGFGIGLLITAGLFAIGLVRAALAMLAGRDLQAPTPSDYRGLAFYAAGIVTATVFLSITWPLLKPGIARHTGFAVAGTIFVAALVLGGDDGRTMLSDVVGWMIIVPVGIAIGIIASFLVSRHSSSRRGLTRS